MSTDTKIPAPPLNRSVHDALTRRHFLAISGTTLTTLPSAPSLLGEPQTEAHKPASFGYRRYSELLEAIEKRGHKLRVLGYGPDRSPVVAVRAGGHKKPAIFISAGSHSASCCGTTLISTRHTST